MPIPFLVLACYLLLIRYVLASNIDEHFLVHYYLILQLDFGKFHPAGSLGKKLILKVKDIMASGSNNATVGLDAMLKDAVVELSKKGLGIVSVVNDENELKGVITDGDLRRQLEKGADIYSLTVKDVMSIHPSSINYESLAVEALVIMKNRNISSMPVLSDDGKVIGVIRLHDIIGIGIVG